MFKHALIAALAIAAPAQAEDLSAYGTTNPEEMTLNRMVENATRGETDMMTCASAYGMTKGGDHDEARAVFGACAGDGYTQAMTWMSYLDDNGYGGPYDPDASTQWTRQAGLAGDPMGMYNYGLDILRQHGTSADAGEGRAWIDRAAEAGHERAAMLQAADYDWDAVTPDADVWKYAPLF